MGIAASIDRIRAAGFAIEAEGDNLMVEPFSNLSDAQLGWLKCNKAEILAALLDAGQAGADHLPANDHHRASVDHLPLRLKAAAVRVCIEVHNDPPEAIDAMLLGLAHYPPEVWPKLTQHFESQLPEDFDNRRTCRQCRNLIGAGGCRAAQRGEIPTAISTWKPDPERLRRCVAYLPDRDDTDQRTGRDRWPGLELVPGIHKATP